MADVTILGPFCADVTDVFFPPMEAVGSFLPPVEESYVFLPPIENIEVKCK